MYQRGDKVLWWSRTIKQAGTAVFVEYDPDLPLEYCILAIKIGITDPMVHMFRWPLRGVVIRGEGRKIQSSTNERKGS